MKNSFVLLTLLIVLINTQHGTLITHYDLEGNLLYDEVMAPIEEEIIYYDSNESQINSSDDQETQIQPNQLSDQQSQDSANVDSEIQSENILKPVESIQQQTNLIGSAFEIQPVVNQQPQIETSIEQQHNKEQDNEYTLQEDHINENFDSIAQQQQIPKTQVSQQQDELSIENKEMQLQPVVVTSNQVIDLQQDIDQHINSSDINNLGEQTQQTTQNSIQTEQEDNKNELNLSKPNSDLNNISQQPEQIISNTKKTIQDMPIQEQIIVQSGNEYHTSTDSLNPLQEDQEKQSDIKIQTIKADDQFEVTQNFGRIIQDMIPESEDDIPLQEPQEEQTTQLEKLQSSQIEEDIKFNNEDEQQSDQTTQIKQDNEISITQQNKQIEQNQQIDLDVQEITQESSSVKREVPEDFQQQIVNPLEKNIDKQVSGKINNPFEDEGLKLSSEVFQDKCIVIYSQCEFQGFALEVCDSLKDIEKFKHQIKSIYIPKGYGLTIFENQNFNGQSHRYTSSQTCIQRGISFIQLQMDQLLKITHQNLRGQH